MDFSPLFGLSDSLQYEYNLTIILFHNDLKYLNRWKQKLTINVLQQFFPSLFCLIVKLV